MELFALASLALVAGVVSFTAPCTLPLLPGYVAYISGMSDSEQTVPTSRVLLAAALFVAGFSAVFVALGVTASGLGLLLAQNGRLLELVGGVFIVAMGLVTAGVLRIGLLQRQLRVDMSRVGRGPRAAAPLGAAFAFGWTPCIGPVLAGVLITAASTTTMAEGGILLALAAAVARGRVRLGWLRRHSRKLEITGGILLVIMGVAVLSGQWTEFMSSMLAVYARLGWPPI